MNVSIPDLQTASCTDLAEAVIELKAELDRRVNRRAAMLGLPPRNSLPGNRAIAKVTFHLGRNFEVQDGKWMAHS